MKLNSFIGVLLIVLMTHRSKSIRLGSNNKTPGTETATDKRDDLYLIKLKGVKCYNIDPSAFANGTCKIRAVRGHQGILNLFFIYNNIPRLTTTYKLLYRNGNGRYMPYFVDINIDYCKIFSENMNVQSLVVKLFLKLWIKFDTAIVNGCPLNGVANYTNFEMDKLKHFIFPRIVPAGDYVFYVRNFDTSTNKTLLEIKVFGFVKSISVEDLTMLNMG